MSDSNVVGHKRLPNIAKFVRQKDYEVIAELGRGACGVTVKLRDPEIDEVMVCKKYVPAYESMRDELFAKFKDEIKLLYKLNHKNIVRVFNYHLYDNKKTGYILMEYVDGKSIDAHLADDPQDATSLFEQAVEGFSYLEDRGVLHRDIRPANLMVSTDGQLKIIDFGFGKFVDGVAPSFDKSVSLNWAYEPPSEFAKTTYDFKTDVYFVGKLFESILSERKLTDFGYPQILGEMCNRAPERRPTFREVKSRLVGGKFVAEFSEEEVLTYREFSDALSGAILKIEESCKYVSDIGDVIARFEIFYKSNMLESIVLDNTNLTRIFLSGTYYYKKHYEVDIDVIRRFIYLLRASSVEKRAIILNNIHSRLDAVARYKEAPFADDIPF